MSLLFETIRIEHGRAMHLEWHLKRIASSLEQKFGKNWQEDFQDITENTGVHPLSLAGELDRMTLPDDLHKCRVKYDLTIADICMTPYQRKNLRTFRLIEDNSISYDFKFADRRSIDRLFALRGNADDIIILKNGCITDTSIANLVFFDGLNYFTPDTPLLPGTHRARLLAEGKIHERRITVNDLRNYVSFKPVNAMSEEGFGDMIPVVDIIF